MSDNNELELNDAEDAQDVDRDTAVTTDDATTIDPKEASPADASDPTGPDNPSEPAAPPHAPDAPDTSAPPPKQINVNDTAPDATSNSPDTVVSHDAASVAASPAGTATSATITASADAPVPSDAPAVAADAPDAPYASGASGLTREVSDPSEQSEQSEQAPVSPATRALKKEAAQAELAKMRQSFSKMPGLAQVRSDKSKKSNRSNRSNRSNLSGRDVNVAAASDLDPDGTDYDTNDMGDANDRSDRETNDDRLEARHLGIRDARVASESKSATPALAGRLQKPRAGSNASLASVPSNSSARGVNIVYNEADLLEEELDMMETFVIIEGREYYLNELELEQLQKILKEHFRCKDEYFEREARLQNVVGCKDEIVRQLCMYPIVLGADKAQHYLNGLDYIALGRLLKKYYGYDRDMFKKEKIRSAEHCKQAILNKYFQKRRGSLKTTLRAKAQVEVETQREMELVTKKEAPREDATYEERYAFYMKNYTLHEMHTLLMARYEYHKESTTQRFDSKGKAAEEIVKKEMETIKPEHDKKKKQKECCSCCVCCSMCQLCLYDLKTCRCLDSEHNRMRCYVASFYTMCIVACVVLILIAVLTEMWFLLWFVLIIAIVILLPCIILIVRSGVCSQK